MPICHWVWRLSQRRRADLSRGTMCGSATAPDLASEPPPRRQLASDRPRAHPHGGAPPQTARLV